MGAPRRNTVYTVYKIPVDSYDDPPICGEKLNTFGNYAVACKFADLIMEHETDSKYAYFVLDINNFCPYNVGYMEEIEVTGFIE